MAKAAIPRRGTGRAATPAKARKAPLKAAPKRAARTAPKRAAKPRATATTQRLAELTGRVERLENFIRDLNENPRFLDAIGQRPLTSDGNGGGEGGGGDGP